MSLFSVRKPYTVAVCVILIIILGVISFMNMTTDLLPSLNLPYILVITPFPGASPEKVELSVTKPIESMLSTISGLEEMNSVSGENSSMVILQFEQGTNMDKAMIELSSFMDRVKGSFEEGVSAPIMMQLDPDMLPVMALSIDSDNMDLFALSDMVKDEIQPNIERIEGVGSVEVSGLLEKNVIFELDQTKIDALNIEVLRAVDEELAEKQLEIDDARAELDEGKSKLEREQKKRSKELAEAAQALSEGKAKLEDGIKQIDEAISQMKTIKQALPIMKEAMDTAAKGYQDLQVARLQTIDAAKQKKQLEQLRAGIDNPSYAAGYAVLYAAYQAAGADPASPEAAACMAYIAPLTQVIGSLPIPAGTPMPDLTQPVSDVELAAMVAVASPLMGAALAVMPGQEAIDAIDLAIKESDSAINALYDGLYDLTAQFEMDLLPKNGTGLSTTWRITLMQNAMIEAERQVKQMEVELPDKKIELEETLEDLREKEIQLEQGKVTLTTEFAKAGAALDIGEKQLEAGEEQFEDAKEQAYKQAGLDGVITKEMISQVLFAQNFAMPAGYVVEGEEKYMVKVGNQLTEVDHLKNLVLFHVEFESIGDIMLTDVGTVRETDNKEDIYAIINGNEGVIMTVQKQSLYSTAEVCEKLRKEIERMEEAYPGLHVTALQDQGVYIKLVTDSVIENLMYGGLLAVLVLILFLRDWKPTIIIALSIPISLMFSVVLMYFSGVTLNLISLSGLALGVGMLVDNSIVAIENIYRLRTEGVPVFNACVRGVKEIAAALTSSTLTTVSVFLPIVFTNGMTRELFTDMGLTIAYSLFASLLVALTLVPAMGSFMLTAIKEPKRRAGGSRVYNAYEKKLRRMLKRKAPLLIVVTGLLALCAVVAVSMGTQMFPEMESDQVSISISTGKGSTNAEIRAISDTLIQRVSAMPEVKTVGAMQQDGGGNMLFGGGGGGGSGHTISMYALLDEKRETDNKEIAQRIMDFGADLDCEISVETTQMDMSMLTGSGISVTIEGYDLDVLYAISDEIAGMLERTEGTADISNGMEDANVEVRVVVDKNEAMQYGLTTAQVFAEVAKALKTDTTATNLSIQGEEYPLVVRYDEKLTRATLKNYPLTVKKDGEEVVIALSDITDIKEAQSPVSIRHQGQTRIMTVTAGIADGYNIGLVSREFEAEINAYVAPDGYKITLEGENEAINTALQDVTYMVLLAIVFIYLIMVAQFQSLLSPFIVLFTIPLAFTGGFLALILCGFEISIIAMIGMLMLAGIVVNNGIVFVETVNQLRAEGMDRTEALVKTGTMRMRPILMTALTTILALTTMALGFGAGASMVQPMAVVTIGGLSYATLLTLFVVPVIYDIFQKKQIKQREWVKEGGKGEQEGEDSDV